MDQIDSLFILKTCRKELNYDKVYIKARYRFLKKDDLTQLTILELL